MSSDLFKIVFINDLSHGCDNLKFRPTPFAIESGKIFQKSIKKVKKLTQGEDVRTVYSIAFDLADTTQDFLPGDTIGILPSNNKTTIDKLFQRLNLNPLADKPCELKILKETKKIQHLPHQTTLREIFSNHVDIQTPPKKLFLKSLTTFTQDPDERSTLEKISSPKPSKEYTQFITKSGRTLLGLLQTFPSCHPPVELILQNLPPLQPRPYSISSSPLSTTLEITFFVLEHDDGRKGVCTGWLENLILEKSTEKINFYFRKPTTFRLCQEVQNPVILVATGTGIAPFRGFLQHLKFQKRGGEKVWFFYGCRYKDRDFLYKGEVEGFEGLKSNVAFSREGEKIYVQTCIESFRDLFADWVESGATIFLCGHVTTVKSVKICISKILGVENFQELESRGVVMSDSWT